MRVRQSLAFLWAIIDVDMAYKGALRAERLNARLIYYCGARDAALAANDPNLTDDKINEVMFGEIDRAMREHYEQLMRSKRKQTDGHEKQSG